MVQYSQYSLLSLIHKNNSRQCKSREFNTVQYNYMSCPIELKTSMNKTSISKVLPTDALNGEGVKKVGPCILMVLCRPAVKMVKIKVSWHKKIDKIVNESKLLHDALESPEGL